MVIFARFCSTARRLHAKFSFRDSEINRNQARPALNTNSDPILYSGAHPPPPVKQLRIYPNVPDKKRLRIPIKLAI